MKLIRRELWKPVPGFPNYEVSNYGRVRNIVTGKVLKPVKNSNGYYTVTLYSDRQGKNFYIHRLVAELFIGPEPKNSECNHKLGIKSSCEVWNLEWSTPKENMKHAYTNNLIPIRKGENAPHAKLTDEEVEEIRQLYEERLPFGTRKYTQSDLSKMFGVCKEYVGQIILGRRRTTIIKALS